RRWVGRGRPGGGRGPGDGQRDRGRQPFRGQRVVEDDLAEPERVGGVGPAERGGQHVRAAVGGEQRRRELEGGAGRVGDDELRGHRVQRRRAERDGELNRPWSAPDEHAAGRRRRGDRAEQGGG